MRRGTFAAAILALFAGSAQAQTPVATPEVQRSLTAFSDSAEFAALRREQQQRVITIWGETCAPAVQMRRTDITLLSDIALDQQGKVQSGSWLERHDVIGCKYTTRANFAMSVTPGQPTRVIPLLPGSSVADTRLQLDILPGVVGVAMAVRKDPDCKQRPVFADTAFNGWTGAPVPDALSGPTARPWEETWAIYLCGRVVDVVIRFTPDSKGTGYDIPGKDAHMRP